MSLTKEKTFVLDTVSICRMRCKECANLAYALMFLQLRLLGLTKFPHPSSNFELNRTRRELEQASEKFSNHRFNAHECGTAKHDLH